MKLIYPTASSRQFYDRNSISVSKTFTGIVGPHGLTQRWLYTVPAGRKAFVTSVSLTFRRVTAAAPVGEVLAQISGTVAGSVTNIALIRSLNNNLEARIDIYPPCSSLMIAADNLAMNTQDPGTGGTVDYTGSLTVVEFDA